MTQELKSLSEIIEYAISKEREAQATYSEVAEKARHPSSRTMLAEMAEAEEAHEKALRDLDVSKLPEMPAEKTEDLRIAEFLKEVELKPDSDFQEIIIYAIKREEVARDFYDALAKDCENPDAKKLFELLAEQELGHKRKLETIYDDEVLREN